MLHSMIKTLAKACLVLSKKRERKTHWWVRSIKTYLMISIKSLGRDSIHILLKDKLKIKKLKSE